MIDHVKRGIAAGAVAGAAYGLFVWLVLHPLVEALEGAARHGHEGHEHGHAVAEATTVVVSAGGGVLWGIVLGAGFGAAYYLLEPALPGGRGKPYVLAAAGLLTVSAAPWLVVPPTTPAAEATATTGTRLWVYVGMMVLGASSSAASILAYDRYRADGRPKALAGAAVPLAGLVGVGLAAPTLTGTPEVSAALASAFTWLVAFGQAGLWVVLAGTFDRIQGGIETGSGTDVPGYPAD